jgi:hypothetical protein
MYGNNLHVCRLGRVSPGWGITRLRRAIYFVAFGHGIAIRWCERV